jgi:hypothetical protein
MGKEILKMPKFGHSSRIREEEIYFGSYKRSKCDCEREQKKKITKEED